MGDTSKARETRSTAPAVERAARILDLVAESGETATVSNIARELGLAKSTVHGLCGTLIELGMLERKGQGFGIGGHVMLWANAFIGKSDMVAEFVRLWDDVPGLENETATLTILDGNEVVYIASRHGEDPLGITFRNGMRLPAAFTATGKAIISTMPRDIALSLYPDGLPAALTSNSVASLEALERELQETRARGFSIDNEQVRQGMVCLGAPVFDFSGENAVGGLALSMHSSHVTAEAVDRLGAYVTTCARTLSQRLGAKR